MQPTRESISLNSIDTGSGEPVVWIHGFPLSSESFEPQLAIAGVRHIVPDLPGFGRSPNDPELEAIPDYVEHIMHMLDEKEIAKATFAGVSMGGYIVMSILQTVPERVDAVILIDTRETPDSEAGRRGRYESIANVRESGTGSVVESMLPKMLSANAGAETRQRLEGIMRSASRDGVIAALNAMAVRRDSSDVLPKISVPTLVVVGSNDAITPPEDARRMASIIPSAQLIEIEGAGHMSNLEKPAEFNRAVEDFLVRTGRIKR